MGSKAVDKGLVEKNPRSTTVKHVERFTKTSHELNLAKEAEELDRCRELNIMTQHVRALELLDFQEKTNQLTTKTITQGQILFNRLWNETSILARLKRKAINRKIVLGIVEEIGCWLRLYHGSSDYPGYGLQAAVEFSEIFRKKLNYIRTHQILEKKIISRIETFFFRS